MSDTVFAQIIVCQGASCHLQEIDLMAIWFTNKLYTHVGISRGECMGLCENAPVICIITKQKTYFLERMDLPALRSLVGWATEIKNHNKSIPLPSELQSHEFEYIKK